MATASEILFTASPTAQIDDLLMRICAALQLDETRYELAKGAYEAVGKWLESRPTIYSLRPAIYPQGSMRLNTSVKPTVGDEFDLDFVCEFACHPNSFAHPIQALDLVEQALAESDLYRPKLKRLNRCMRISYERKFHLDILPACHDPKDNGTCILVPDRELRAWVPSNPKGYAEWFDQRTGQLLIKHLLARGEPVPDQEELERKAPLKLCVQLMKRARDLRYKTRFAPKPISIVLTTLAADFYLGELSISDAMSSILMEISEAVRVNRPRLIVRNPTNPDEDLSERWDDQPAAYREFVGYTIEFQTRWKELLQQRGTDRIARSLKQMFGEEITATALDGQTQDIEAARARKQLAMRKGSGLITTAASASAVPIRSNTFYGATR